jgi:hypothetical protein
MPVTNTELKRMFRENHKVIDEFYRSTTKLRKWARVRGEEKLLSYIRTIEGRSWDALAKGALRELEARSLDRPEMEKVRERVISHGKWLDTLAAQAAPNIVALRRNWSVLSERFRQALLDRGVARAKTDEILDRYESLNQHKLQQDLAMGVERTASDLNRSMQGNLAATMGASIALAVARFNQNAGVGSHPALTPEAFCEQATATLVTIEREVWRALRSADLSAASANARELARQAEMALEGVLEHAAAISVTRSGSSHDFVRDGRQALLIGDLIRSLLRAIALGHYVAWSVGWPESMEPTGEWLREARELPFPSKVKLPRTVSIASLAAQSARWDGKAVTIEGLLGAVKIVHRGRKVISSAPVSDIDGKSVTIVIPYIKLDSAGMVPGAYVRISGVWQEHSQEVNGPALQIDRLNFGELGKASWSDWATAKLRPVYTPVPHGLAASWSWEPGTDGPGNQLRYATWFANTERSI